jgi:hypothetical protein
MGQLNVFRRQLCEPLFNIRKLSCGVTLSNRNAFRLRQSELMGICKTGPRRPCEAAEAGRILNFVYTLRECFRSAICIQREALRSHGSKSIANDIHIFQAISKCIKPLYS